MGKCTFCSHRLSDGLKPACAELCPTGALDYAVLPANQLTAEIEGFPRTDLGPSIRILPRSDRSGHREQPPPVGNGSTVLEATAVEPSIRPSSEWSLAGFTFLLAVLFGSLTAAAFDRREVPPIAFAVLAAVAAMLSLAHLGKPARAWRAILNLRRSPVSREVLGFGGLASLGTLSLAWPTGAVATALGWLGLAAGLLALVSADLVYRPGILAGSGWMAAPVGAFKLYVYLRRRVGEISPTNQSGSARAWPTAVARIGLGLAIPGIAWVASGTPLPAWVILSALIGEALDRAGFYSRLEIVSPVRQLRVDLEARLARYEAGPAIRSTASASSS